MVLAPATSGRQAGGDKLQRAAHDPLPEDGQADLCVSGSGATASASERAFGEVDGRCCSAQDEGELTASILLSGTVELAVFILVAAFQRNDSSTFV